MPLSSSDTGLKMSKMKDMGEEVMVDNLFACGKDEEMEVLVPMMCTEY